MSQIIIIWCDRSVTCPLNDTGLNPGSASRTRATSLCGKWHKQTNKSFISQTHTRYFSQTLRKLIFDHFKHCLNHSLRFYVCLLSFILAQMYCSARVMPHVGKSFSIDMTHLKRKFLLMIFHGSHKAYTNICEAIWACNVDTDVVLSAKFEFSP